MRLHIYLMLHTDTISPLYCDYSSKAKFDSGSGWPSFYEALVSEESGETNVLCCGDNSHGMIRKEVVCRKVTHMTNDHRTYTI